MASSTLSGGKTLDSVTNMDTLGKIVTGITKTQINSIPNAQKVATIVNLVNASVINGVDMTSTQVILFDLSVLHYLFKFFLIKNNFREQPHWVTL